MKKALFQPFDLRKWLVVGFTAFLSGFTDCHGGSGSKGEFGGKGSWKDVMEFPMRAQAWILDHPGWVALIIAGACVLVLLVVVFAWLSSRGKFIFLHNVIHDRAEVAAPWHEYKAEGNSLFLWTLSFGIVALAVVSAYVVGCYGTLYGLYERHGTSGFLTGPAIGMVLGLVGVGLLIGFVVLLLSAFVVPIMYRHRVNTMRAWSMFMKLFWSEPLHFLGYALVMFLVTIGVIVGVVVIGLLTCCVGFLLLVVPYIRDVVLLPVSYTLRAFSIEFLGQFGPEFEMLRESGAGEAGRTAPRP
jgi:hypothetical protein